MKMKLQKMKLNFPSHKLLVSKFTVSYYCLKFENLSHAQFLELASENYFFEFKTAKQSIIILRTWFMQTKLKVNRERSSGKQNALYLLSLPLLRRSFALLPRESLVEE